MGFRDITEEQFVSLNYDEREWEDEMIVMAETEAYVHVAYKVRHAVVLSSFISCWRPQPLKRVIDKLPCVIDLDFLRSIQNEVQGALIKGLELDTENATRKAQLFLAEDPSVSMRRTELQRKKTLLERVLKNLVQFGQ